MKHKGQGPRGAPRSGAASWQALRGARAPAAAPDRLAQLFAAASEHHRQGRLREARDAYQHLLALDPRHADASHALGLLAHQAGSSEVGARLLARAVELAPDNGVFHSNLGVVLVALGRTEEAIASHRQALRREPGRPEVHSNLGVALLQHGRAREAAEAQRRALTLRPRYPEAHANLALALVALGQHDEAVASLRQALALRPDYVNAHVWLGDALARAADFEPAVSSYRTALSLQPDHAAAHQGLGRVWRRLGRNELAADNFRAAIYVRPAAGACADLAATLADLGRPEEAIDAYRQALALAPGDAAVAGALAALLDGLGRPEEAAAVAASPGEPAGAAPGSIGDLEADEARYRIALTVDPANPVPHVQLGTTLVAMGRLAEAREHYREALRLRPDDFGTWSDLLFAMNYSGDLPVAEMAEAARAYGRAVAARVVARHRHDNLPDPGRRLRVGFVSGDFRRHVIPLFLESVLAALDRERLELVAYSTAAVADATTERLRPAFARWHDAARLDDDALEAAILADRIDILVDLSGHTAGNRLPVFARKPAPVAVTWLGYFATTGLSGIDYVLANHRVLPEAEQDQWVEKAWRLPDTYLCFTPPRVAVPLAPSPALATGLVTFGSANNLSKLSDATVDCWAGVLRAVASSRLLLRADALRDARVVARTQARFAARGVAPDRLLLEGPTSDYAAHLGQYNRVDIALDPFPYGGGTTSVEALWMGVPVLTRRGDRYVSHMGESLLATLGLPEWIAADGDDYVDKAAALAADLPALATLRQGLRHRLLASPLADAPRFASHLEDAFRAMWVAWCARQGGDAG